MRPMIEGWKGSERTEGCNQTYRITHKDRVRDHKI